MKWIKILICLNCSGNGCTASENIRSKYVILNIPLPVYTDKKGVDKESRKKSYVSPDQKIKLFSEASELRGSTVCCVCIYVFVMNV